MPTEPSVMIQVFSPLALRLAAISASAHSGTDCETRGLEGAVPGPLRFPERKALYFF
jgi:hypothetical protein